MASSSPIRVLVVEDEVAIRCSLIAFLEDSGFEVTAAGSGEEALEVLTRTPCDVGVVALRLPGASGESMILQANGSAPSMHFVLFTGSVNYRISEELRGIGMRPEHVFRKPLPDMTPLVEGIRNLVEKAADDGTQ
ncbi:MAG: response regulator [Nitrospiraceae bacterium]|nr:response regulator [Nitrospiraceae bacterium]